MMLGGASEDTNKKTTSKFYLCKIGRPRSKLKEAGVIHTSSKKKKQQKQTSKVRNVNKNFKVDIAIQRVLSCLTLFGPDFVYEPIIFVASHPSKLGYIVWLLDLFQTYSTLPVIAPWADRARLFALVQADDFQLLPSGESS